MKGREVRVSIFGGLPQITVYVYAGPDAASLSAGLDRQELKEARVAIETLEWMIDHRAPEQVTAAEHERLTRLALAGKWKNGKEIRRRG